MKRIAQLGALLLTVAAFGAQAQTPTGNATGSAGSVGTRTSPNRSNMRVGTTNGTLRTDGSTDGSVTNDGASGQSGSPVPNPPAATRKGVAHTTKQSARKTKTTSSSSASTSSSQSHQ